MARTFYSALVCTANGENPGSMICSKSEQRPQKQGKLSSIHFWDELGQFLVRAHVAHREAVVIRFK